jgi:hypothetical protein
LPNTSEKFFPSSRRTPDRAGPTSQTPYQILVLTAGAEVAGSSTSGGSDGAGPAHGSPAPGCGERRQGLAHPPAAGSPTTQGGRKASARLGDEGRRAGGEGVLVVKELTNHNHGVGGGGGVARSRRAAPAVGARSPRTQHGRRQNQREWKGGAAQIIDRVSVRAEVAGGERSAGSGGGARYGAWPRGGCGLLRVVGCVFFYLTQGAGGA